MKKICLLLALVVLFVMPEIGRAQVSPSPTPSPTQSATDLQNRINELQAKITDLQGQEKTLSSQIAVMDSQINLTELRIDSTKRQISDLSLDIDTTTKKIGKVERSLDDLSKVLINRVVATYIAGSTSSFQTLLSSSDFTDFVKRANYLRIAQAHDRKLIFDTVQAKNDYTNQKIIYENKKTEAEKLQADLTTYSNQLDQEKQNKAVLLSQTQGNEANYQSLLAQARAQLSSLAGFSSARFGTSLVPHSDLSDGFGRYYNQRDSSWGDMLVNNDTTDCRGGPCTIARIGCLITSYAMVVTHYGGSVNPADIAVNSSYFSANTASFNKPGPSANGHSAESRDNPSLDDLRNAINSGAVVIAGISSDGGPYPNHYSDHWVVLRSVEGDTFRINDPAYEGAMNVLLSDRYSGWTIIESRIYH